MKLWEEMLDASKQLTRLEFQPERLKLNERCLWFTVTLPHPRLAQLAMQQAKVAAGFGHPEVETSHSGTAL